MSANIPVTDKRALHRAVDDVAAVVGAADASASGSKGCQNPHRRNWACEKSAMWKQKIALKTNVRANIEKQYLLTNEEYNNKHSYFILQTNSELSRNLNRTIFNLNIKYGFYSTWMSQLNKNAIKKINEQVFHRRNSFIKIDLNKIDVITNLIPNAKQSSIFENLHLNDQFGIENSFKFQSVLFHNLKFNYTLWLSLHFKNFHKIGRLDK